MKAFILCAIFAVSQAAVLLHGTGASTQYRSQDGLGNYAFGYNEGHGSGATFRKESGGHGVVAGSYGLTDADGRQRVVNYVADAGGFRADINTNEPGVEPKDPAATTINKAGVLVASPTVHHAPVLHHAPIAPTLHHAPIAPVLHHAPVAPALHHAAVAPALHHAPVVHHGGAFAYNTAIGHNGFVGHHLNYAALPHHAHHGYYF